MGDRSWRCSRAIARATGRSSYLGCYRPRGHPRQSSLPGRLDRATFFPVPRVPSHIAVSAGCYHWVMPRKDPARLDPAERREQILRVAAEHFARNDFDASSVTAIAERAGVTRALVYHYFPGRGALLDAVLRAESDAVLAATAPDPDLSPRQNLERALNVYLHHYAMSSGRIRDVYDPPAGAPGLVRQLADENHQAQIRRVLEYLGRAGSSEARLAVGAWLAFVVEAARASVAEAAVPRRDVVELCIRVLEAAAGEGPGRHL